MGSLVSKVFLVKSGLFLAERAAFYIDRGSFVVVNLFWKILEKLFCLFQKMTGSFEKQKININMQNPILTQSSKPLIASCCPKIRFRPLKLMEKNEVVYPCPISIDEKNLYPSRRGLPFFKDLFTQDKVQEIKKSLMANKSSVDDGTFCENNSFSSSSSSTEENPLRFCLKERAYLLAKSRLRKSYGTFDPVNLTAMPPRHLLDLVCQIRECEVGKPKLTPYDSGYNTPYSSPRIYSVTVSPREDLENFHPVQRPSVLEVLMEENHSNVPESVREPFSRTETAYSTVSSKYLEPRQERKAIPEYVLVSDKDIAMKRFLRNQPQSRFHYKVEGGRYYVPNKHYQKVLKALGR